MNRAINLETKHYVVIGAFLVSLGAQVSGLAHGFHDALTPAFVGGLIGQLGTVIAALAVGSPVSRDPEKRERRGEQGAGV